MYPRFNSGTGTPTDRDPTDILSGEPDGFHAATRVGLDERGHPRAEVVQKESCHRFRFQCGNPNLDRERVLDVPNRAQVVPRVAVPGGDGHRIALDDCREKVVQHVVAPDLPGVEVLTPLDDNDFRGRKLDVVDTLDDAVDGQPL
jgi:hypothetical protein